MTSLPLSAGALLLLSSLPSLPRAAPLRLLGVVGCDRLASDVLLQVSRLLVPEYLTIDARRSGKSAVLSSEKPNMVVVYFPSLKVLVELKSSRILVFEGTTGWDNYPKCTFTIHPYRQTRAYLLLTAFSSSTALSMTSRKCQPLSDLLAVVFCNISTWLVSSRCIWSLV